MTATTQPTKADQAADRMAQRLRDIGWTVETESSDRDPQLYSDGDIMLHGAHYAGFVARGPILGQVITGQWLTHTTGRRTTKFVSGSTWSTYSTSTRRLNQRDLWNVVNSAVGQAHFGWLRDYLVAQGLEPTPERMLDTRLMTACLQARKED